MASPLRLFFPLYSLQFPFSPLRLRFCFPFRWFRVFVCLLRSSRFAVTHVLVSFSLSILLTLRRRRRRPPRQTRAGPPSPSLSLSLSLSPSPIYLHRLVDARPPGEPASRTTLPLLFQPYILSPTREHTTTLRPPPATCGQTHTHPYAYAFPGYSLQLAGTRSLPSSRDAAQIIATYTHHQQDAGRPQTTHAITAYTPPQPLLPGHTRKGTEPRLTNRRKETQGNH
jgi:hypothetical protein